MITEKAMVHSQLQDLPSSGAAHAEVTSALANTGEDLASRPWRERPAFYDKAIQTTVQKLMLGYNRSELPDPL